MSDFNTLITSVDRSQQYINKCLVPLQDKDVRVLVYGASDNYIEKKNVKTVLLSTDILHELSKISKPKRAGYNYHRCLTLDRNKDALILEDDTVLSPMWEKNLADCLSRITNDKFMLSLWHAWSWLMPPPDDIVQQFVNPIISTGEGAVMLFWSITNAVYYSSNLLKSDMPEYLKRELFEQETDEFLYDQIIGKYCFYNHVPVYLCIPPLAENIGKESSIRPLT
jgi:hypothetical protein